MNEMKTSFHNNCWHTILLWKISLSEKWVFNNTTLGFLFIKGLSFHEWNKNHPYTKTAVAVKLYYCENFHFLKSKF